MSNPSAAAMSRKRPRWRILLRVILGLALLLLIFALKTVYTAGEFKRLKPHFSGTIRALSGVVGGEDITIDHDAMIAYISADDRYARAHGQKDAVGAIYSLALSDRKSEPVMMQRNPDQPIAPHGISLVMGSDGKKYMYVVDHYQHDTTVLPSHRILLYSIESNRELLLIQSFENSQYLVSPNDVVGIDEKRFYFTNDHGSADETSRKLEEYLQLKKSNIVYFDGKAYRFVADELAMANGINLSQDGKELYVASTLGKCLVVYDRDPLSGNLSNRLDVHLNTGVDNIERDEFGNLWIGCHPKLLTFMRHASDISRPAPSQVLKIKRTGNRQYLPAEVFLDDGRLISGSAVAAVSGNLLMIGPVMDNKILWCELSDDMQSSGPSDRSE